MNIFKGMFSNDDIRFKYSFAGGTLMDLGIYNVLTLRQMLQAEPVECIEATPRIVPDEFDQKGDQVFMIQWRYPNGAVGDIEVDLAASGGWPFPWLPSNLPSMQIPTCKAAHREVIIQEDSL